MSGARDRLDLSSISLRSERLLLRAFAPSDAREAHAAVTPTLARYMTWDPGPTLESFEEIWRIWLTMMRAGLDAAVAVRLAPNGEFLGMAGLHRIVLPVPEVGIWIKETMHGHGFGREAVAAVVSFAGAELRKKAVRYPVAEQNLPSRRLAERLGGTIVEKGTLRKPNGVELPQVIYRIATDFGPRPRLITPTDDSSSASSLRQPDGADRS